MLISLKVSPLFRYNKDEDKNMSKSRVERYSELRKKISQMDDYSFAKEDKPASNGEETSKETPTRNTLSLSIDELMKEHDSRSDDEKRREVKSRYWERRRKERHQRKAFSMRILAWTLIVLLLVLVIVLIILVITGVFSK